MPSKSKSQANLMRAVAHSPPFARKVGIPVSVGKDFTAADKDVYTRKLPNRVKKRSEGEEKEQYHQEQNDQRL